MCLWWKESRLSSSVQGHIGPYLRHKVKNHCCKINTDLKSDQALWTWDAKPRQEFFPGDPSCSHLEWTQVNFIGMVIITVPSTGWWNIPPKLIQEKQVREGLEWYIWCTSGGSLDARLWAKTASLLIWPNLDADQQRKVVFYILEVRIPEPCFFSPSFWQVFSGKSIEIVITDDSWGTDFLCCIFIKTRRVRKILSRRLCCLDVEVAESVSGETPPRLLLEFPPRGGSALEILMAF